MKQPEYIEGPEALSARLVFQVIDGQMLQDDINELSGGYFAEVSGPNDLAEIVGCSRLQSVPDWLGWRSQKVHRVWHGTDGEYPLRQLMDFGGFRLEKYPSR